MKVVDHPLPLGGAEVSESVGEGVSVEPVFRSQQPLCEAPLPLGRGEVSEAVAEGVAVESVLAAARHALVDGDPLVDRYALVDGDALAVEAPVGVEGHVAGGHGGGGALGRVEVAEAAVERVGVEAVAGHLGAALAGGGADQFQIGFVSVRMCVC